VLRNPLLCQASKRYGQTYRNIESNLKVDKQKNVIANRIIRKRFLSHTKRASVSTPLFFANVITIIVT